MWYFELYGFYPYPTIITTLFAVIDWLIDMLMFVKLLILAGTMGIFLDKKNYAVNYGSIECQCAIVAALYTRQDCAGKFRIPAIIIAL